jgi:hypothetical protein
MLEGLDRAAFARATDVERRALCDRLSAVITERLSRARSFRAGVGSLVSELRAAGHDLWSFDEDGKSWELWCANWVEPTGPGIIVAFCRDGPSTVSWAKGSSVATT